MSKTVLFQAIRFSISTQSIRLLYRTLAGTINPGQSELGNDDSKGVCHIPQSFSIIGASPPDYLVSYLGYP